MSTTSRGPSRRTLVKGAAWSVPVVAVAGAAPAMAASPPIDPTYQAGTFCKHPNVNGYHAVFCFTNTTTEAIEIRFTSMTVAGTNGAQTLTPTSLVVPGDSTVCSYVDGHGFNSMPEALATLNFEYDYNGGVVQGSVDTSLDGNQQVTPCGTHPRDDQPRWPHGSTPDAARARADNAAAENSTEAPAPVESTEAPAPVENSTEPVAPETEPAPAPAPGDDASATSAP